MYDLPAKLIFSKELPQLTGFTLRYIAKLEKADRFPKRLKLGARRIAWNAAEVAKWQRGEWKKSAPDESASVRFLRNGICNGMNTNHA